MNPPLKASRVALDLIMRFEGLRPQSVQIADGRWVVGYGHTKAAREGVTISEDDAAALLLYDVMAVQAVVNEAVLTPVSQNQFDALVAFAFNIGVDNFRQSTVLSQVNLGNLMQAACAIEMWRKSELGGERVVVDALVRRRAAEKTLFLTPDAGALTPAPSSLIGPRVDYDVGASLPKASAAAVVEVSEGRLTARWGDLVGGAGAVPLAEADAGIDLPPASAPYDTPAEAIRRISRREAPKAVMVEAAVERGVRLSTPQLFIQALVGLALFLGAVFWGVTAKGMDGPVNPVLIAAVLGLAGVALVANAVYYLLMKLDTPNG